MTEKLTLKTGRPAELTGYLEITAQSNDALIVNALATLEDPKARGALKPTVASVERLTGLSRNTIRNRTWALERLRGLKRKVKDQAEDANPANETIDQGAILDKLRKRVRSVLEQNALLYEEVISLKRALEQRERVIEVLSSKTKSNTHNLKQV